MWDKEESYDLGYNDYQQGLPYNPKDCDRLSYDRGWHDANMDLCEFNKQNGAE